LRLRGRIFAANGSIELLYSSYCFSSNIPLLKTINFVMPTDGAVAVDFFVVETTTGFSVLVT
jgi:hypothetical protein